MEKIEEGSPDFGREVCVMIAIGITIVAYIGKEFDVVTVGGILSFITVCIIFSGWWNGVLVAVGMALLVASTPVFGPAEEAVLLLRSVAAFFWVTALGGALHQFCIQPRG